MKKLTILILVFVLCLSLLCGCEAGKTETPQGFTETTVPVTEVQADYEEIYGEILNSTYSLITSDKTGIKISEAETGIAEAVAGIDADKALGVVGYTFKDLSGDGFCELIIADVADSEESWYKSSEIFAVYGVVNGTPFPVVAGRARSSYKLLDDGTFFYEGSSGAAYNGVGNFRMSQGGTALICNEFYFTEPDETDVSKVYVYKNKTGKWNTKNSEKTQLTGDEFSDIRKSFQEKAVTLELTPFSDYK